MKIAIFTDHFLPKMDGIVTQLCATIQWLAQMGHEVHVYTIGAAELDIPGITIHNHSSYPLPFFTHRKMALPNFFSVLSHLKTYKPDILHVINATFLSIPAHYYSHQYVCPLIGSIHTDYLTYLDCYKKKFLKPIVRGLLRVSCRQHHATLSPSADFQSKLSDIGIKCSDIWQKGVDTKQFHPQKYSHAIRAHLSQGFPSLPLLVCSGRLSAEKNLSCLRTIFSSLPNIRLAFLGDGPWRNKLAHEFHNTPTFFAGHLRGEALAMAYASADVFVMPSTSDTLGLAALEAMSAGCPVVAANAGGLREVVNSGKDGFLFDPHSVSMMIEFIHTLVTDRSLRQKFSLNARAEAEKWDWNKSAARLLASYKTISRACPS